MLYASKGPINSDFISYSVAPNQNFSVNFGSKSNNFVLNQSFSFKKNIGDNQEIKPICTLCELFEHSIKKCYKKHCYPLGYKPRSSNYIESANQVESRALDNKNAGSVYVNDTKGKQLKYC